MHMKMNVPPSGTWIFIFMPIQTINHSDYQLSGDGKSRPLCNGEVARSIIKLLILIQFYRQLFNLSARRMRNKVPISTVIRS